MNVKAFRGLRPRADLAAKIPSLPYDVLDATEARELAKGDPYTFLHVVKAEIDLDPRLDPHDDRVYARARENFLAMRRDGWLVRDERPGLYLYRLRMGDHVQTGIVGAASVDDYLDGRIKRHEHTRPDKEDDRTRHTDAIGANAGPVFLAYRDPTTLEALMAEKAAQPPVADFVAADGIAHALWLVDDPADVGRFEAALAEVPASYIADGHHRAAAYARVAQLRKGGADRLLAVHFPAGELRILPYNRIVADLNGLTPQDVLRRVEAAGFSVTSPWPAAAPPRAACFGMYLAGTWHLLAASADVVPAGDPVKRLDVALLQDRILGPILGVGDPRTDPRIAFVGGIRGTEELTRRVDRGEAAVAFSMFPTSLDDVMRVADAGRVMPPKSTWFEPKLRSGLVVHLLDDD